jgi:hypothetical protein
MILLHVTGQPHERHYQELTGVLGQFTNIAFTQSPKEAEAIVMSDDTAASIKRSAAYRQFPEKCVAISDSDFMDYYVPALYASNYRGWLSKDRALTCSPYTSLFAAQGKRNAWIDRLRDEPCEKRLLYSFMGGSTSLLRKRLFQHYKSLDIADVQVQSTDYYKHWSPDAGGKVDKSAQQRVYVETMKASKFALCPRGASPSSIRMFEAMELGVAPIVMADTWIPVDGVDWSFCLFIKEDQLGDIDAIVRAHESEWEERGMRARQAFVEHFDTASLGLTLERQFRQLVQQRSPGRERLIHAMYPARQAYVTGKTAARKHLRALVLAGFRVTGRKFPYELNR